jgi:hypothetical protein
MGRPPRHTAFHLEHLSGPAPQCGGLVRSLNARIQNKWQPVAKWCDGCNTVWLFDPDGGVQQPRLQHRETCETWYEVWVADDPGENITAVCKVCGWRSATYKNNDWNWNLEREVNQHDTDTAVDTLDKNGEYLANEGHVDADPDNIEYDYTPVTEEQWKNAWRPRKLPSRSQEGHVDSGTVGQGFRYVETKPTGDPGRSLYPTSEEAAWEAAHDKEHAGTDVVAVEIVVRDLTKQESKAAAQAVSPRTNTRSGG